jgi:hypothetical protein
MVSVPMISFISADIFTSGFGFMAKAWTLCPLKMGTRTHLHKNDKKNWIALNLLQFRHACAKNCLNLPPLYFC